VYKGRWCPLHYLITNSVTPLPIMFSKTAVFAAALTQALPALAIVHEQLAALPVGWTSTSAADESSVVSFTVALTQQNIDQLESRLLAASTPGSPSYGQYLSDDEMKTIFAPTVGASSAVESWLKR
jgi:tripeptidyl-peptidase-1